MEITPIRQAINERLTALHAEPAGRHELICAAMNLGRRTMAAETAPAIDAQIPETDDCPVELVPASPVPNATSLKIDRSRHSAYFI